MSRPIPELPGVNHRFVDAAGLRMHVAEAGDPEAEPVVLVHGWPEHWYAWRRLIGPLAERYRVICPDLRGFGWSDAPAGGYRMDELAGDLLALLDALGLERVRLAGHDWGGYAGFLLCIENPDRVSRFAALAIAHPWTRAERGFRAALKTARRLAYMVPISTPLLGRQMLSRLPAFHRAVFRASAADPAATWSEVEMDAFVDRWREPERARAASALYRSFLVHELPELARGAYRERRLDTPTVLVAADRDPVVRPDGLGGFERNAPRMRLETLDRVGHWIPEEAPEPTLAILEHHFDATD